MSQKKYWKGIEELENTPEFQESVKNEFNEELPFSLSGKLLDATTPRRDFLKFLGFSTAAATLAASCEMPVRKAIPYAIKPDADTITPGVPNYYASSFNDNGECCSVLVRTRDGRPILVEGNPMSSVTKGGVSARVVASTLSLYDTARLRQPLKDGKKVDVYGEIDGPIAQALAEAKGTIYLVTASVTSPTTKEVIARFLAKYPNARQVTFDPISYSALLQANEISYGKKVIPGYDFAKAQTVFSLDADFLGTWLSPVEFTAGFVKNRKVSAKNPVMSKHYQVEGILSVTGASADERATCKPSEYGKVAAALYNAITKGEKPNLTKGLNKLITAAAADLKKGNGLVVSGVNDINVQIIVNAINAAIGANGNTIDWAHPLNYKQGIDADMVALVNAMNAGQVGAVLIQGVNPAYEYFDADKFKEGLKKVPLTVSFASRLDETAELVKYVVPDNHWLESWGDAEPKSGFYSFMQPTIAPLFKTRAFQDSLLKWAGIPGTYHDLLSAFWVGKLGSQEEYDKAIQNGVYEPGAGAAAGGASFGANVADAIAKATAAKSAEYEVVVYPSVALGYGGEWSNNPWLQELPDPITTVTWDNYVLMSPKTAKEKFHAELTGINQVDPNRKVVEVTVNGKTLKLPIVVTPGVNNNVIGIAVGYGRSKGVGRAASAFGQNAYKFVSYNGATFSYDNAVSIKETNETYPLAITQTHSSAEHRPIIHEYTLEEFKKNPNDLINERREELKHFVEIPWEHTEEKEGEDKNAPFDAKKFDDAFVKYGSPYPVQEHQGIHWGMSIDLTSCTGCGACVIACHAENNVSIVGKEQVIKVHEMSWLKIDRYFSGNPDDPDTIQTVFQPMLCMHCDNAPCENVCPVSATNHSSEGLNQMAYNRCIGTKYCANNCPFKVRRFNWFDWNGADSFKDNLYEDGVRDDINDDLERMVLNPDVTVRSRGVMEKCSFCVQRLQDAKLTALKEGMPLKDRHISMACQSACGSDCITFGNVNDPESAVYKERYVENKERLFYMLENLHVLPNVSYLSKIRNTSEVASASSEDGIYEEHL